MTKLTGIAIVDQLLAAAKPRLNDRGNEVRSIFHSASRYIFDTGLTTNRWRHFATEFDQWHFGVWTNKVDLRIVTYAEGDVMVTQCADADSFDGELAHMCGFYAPAPSFTTIDEGTVTRYYEDRREHFVDPDRCPPSPIEFDEDVEEAS